MMHNLSFGSIKKNIIKALLLLFLFFPIYPEEQEEVHFNPWELIIYRSENTTDINDIRCYLKITDEEGNDVTYSSCKATYEWVTIKDRINNYQKSYYLTGGMAMHLNIKKGRYYISFSTKAEDLEYSDITARNEWNSNELFYDTDKSVKVLFVYPEEDDNGFYKGSWKVSYTAPRFYHHTRTR